MKNIRKVLFFTVSLNFILINLFAGQEILLEEPTEVCNILKACDVKPYGALSFGKTIGIDKSYSLAGAWISLDQVESLFFVDANWIHFSNERNGLEFGSGIRFGDSENFYGFNLYYDWLGYHSKSFNQISAGLEGSVKGWEYRLNGYLPLNREITTHKRFEVYPGGYVFRSKTDIYACKLTTFTLGKRFDLSCDLLSNISARVLAGPYFVSAHRHKKNWGGIADIDFDVYNLLQIRTVISRDSIFKTRVQVVASISIPFGCCYEILDTCFSMFHSRPLRQASIATHKQTCCNFNW